MENRNAKILRTMRRLAPLHIFEYQLTLFRPGYQIVLTIIITTCPLIFSELPTALYSKLCKEVLTLFLPAVVK